LQQVTLLCALLFLLVLGGWIFDRWQRHRRDMRVRAVGFPLPWVPLVERGLPLYTSLPHDLREALQEKAFFKINDLYITGPGGVDEVTEDMRVSLGGHIGLLQARLRIPPVPSLRQSWWDQLPPSPPACTRLTRPGAKAPCSPNGIRKRAPRAATAKNEIPS